MKRLFVLAAVILCGVAATVALPGDTSNIEQTTQGPRAPLPVLSSFDGLGIGVATGPGSNNPPVPRNPSDNSIAVGPEHVFQTVNSQLAIFNKAGRILYGPVSTNTLFAGFGGVCEARPNGDAVVRYDQLAGRWLVVMPVFRRTVFDPNRNLPGQPARPGEAARPGVGRPGPPPPLPPPAVRPEGREGQPRQPSPPPPADGTFAMCNAISTSGDPLGTYNRYAFERPLFPDYPRPAIWPDGYYVPTSTGDDVIQKHACVVERVKMLKGEPAREQCIVIDGVNFLNNADVDGQTLPPPGAPNVMMAAGGTQLKGVLRDAVINAWTFHVDWQDYTQTAMDPDDCTVWYVGDYLRKGSATYSSRIGSFRLPGCQSATGK